MKSAPLTSVSYAAIGVFLVSGCTQLQDTYDKSRAALTEILTPADHTETPEIQALIEDQRQREALRRERRQAEAARARRDQLEKDRALIALDLLDKMYRRCMENNDPSACATFQSPWGELSSQLRTLVR